MLSFYNFIQVFNKSNFLSPCPPSPLGEGEGGKEKVRKNKSEFEFSNNISNFL